ncbi:MAG: helix-turn-helix domain-containing protein [Conexivisphaerales archaeon]
MKTYKFKLYPTPLQSKKMEETLETCQRLYNDMLDHRKKTHAGLFEQERLLTQVRKEDKFLKGF